MNKEHSNEAFQRHQNICEREKQRKLLLIENIVDLVSMYNSEDYKLILGDENSPWSGYLGQIEIFYSRAKVERWRKIWKQLISKWDFTPEELFEVPETRLEDICSIGVSKVHISELLEQAKQLTAHDWKIIVDKAKGKVTSEDCKHEDSKTFKICSKCGFKEKIDA